MYTPRAAMVLTSYSSAAYAGQALDLYIEALKASVSISTLDISVLVKMFQHKIVIYSFQFFFSFQYFRVCILFEKR